MVNWINETQPLEVGDLVTHRRFGDGKIDQRRDVGSEGMVHVNFAKTSAWIHPSNLKRIAPDVPDAADPAAVDALERCGDEYAGA